MLPFAGAVTVCIPVSVAPIEMFGKVIAVEPLKATFAGGTAG